MDQHAAVNLYPGPVHTLGGFLVMIFFFNQRRPIFFYVGNPPTGIYYWQRDSLAERPSTYRHMRVGDVSRLMRRKDTDLMIHLSPRLFKVNVHLMWFPELSFIQIPRSSSTSTLPPQPLPTPPLPEPHVFCYHIASPSYYRFTSFHIGLFLRHMARRNYFILGQWSSTNIEKMVVVCTLRSSHILGMKQRNFEGINKSQRTMGSGERWWCWTFYRFMNRNEYDFVSNSLRYLSPVQASFMGGDRISACYSKDTVPIPNQWTPCLWKM